MRIQEMLKTISYLNTKSMFEIINKFSKQDIHGTRRKLLNNYHTLLGGNSSKGNLRNSTVKSDQGYMLKSHENKAPRNLALKMRKRRGSQ
jgi:hypothetical protein